MPTLEELRQMLSRGIGNTKPPRIGEDAEWADVDEAADHLDGLTEDMLKPTSGVDMGRLKRARAKLDAPPKYTKSTDGYDAVLGFGKHKGKSLSQIEDEDPSYLAWLVREFREREDKESKDLVALVLLITEGPF